MKQNLDTALLGSGIKFSVIFKLSFKFKFDVLHRDFSEYEKLDFQEILVKWLLNKNEDTQVNGFTENGSKPTIFHCRVSNFIKRECNAKIKI
jgi:hypothetical protein